MTKQRLADAIEAVGNSAERVGERTTKLYDRTSDAITLDEVERITI